MTSGHNFPRIGEHCNEHGGIFAGIVAVENNGCDCLLFLGPEADEALPWKEASRPRRPQNHH